MDPALGERFLGNGESLTDLTLMELRGIEEALSVVKEKGKKLRDDEGLSKYSFFFGVMNVPVYCLVFAWYPSYFWILYGVELIVLIPLWFSSISRVYHGVLFALDFCWVFNILFAIYMASSLLNVVPECLKLDIFVCFYAIALGPLGWAALLLSNGLIFHSIERTASLTIHMTPTFVTWTLCYYHEQVARDWPGRFPTASELESLSLLQIYTHGLGAYIIWLILHSAWLLSIGIGCPDKGYETVFHDLYVRTNMGSKFESRFGLKSLRSHAACYLATHGVMCMFAFAWPLVCFRFYYLHAAFGALIWTWAVWNGAGYYEYLMAKKYVKLLDGLKAAKEKEWALTKNAQ